MKMYVALISGILLAAPAVAQQEGRVAGGLDHGASSSTPNDTRRTGDTNAQGERVVCRTVSTSSTSRMAARRVCRTEAQWREAQQRDG